MKIAKNKRLALEVRMDAMKSLLPFCWPKLSAQEINLRSLQLQATAHVNELLKSLPDDQTKALEAVALKLAALPEPDAGQIPASYRNALAELPPSTVIDVDSKQG